MISITSKRFWFYTVALTIVVVGMIALLGFGLNIGVELKAGSLMTVEFEEDLAQADLEAGLANLGYDQVIIQTTGTGDYIIRLPEMDTAGKTALEAGMAEQFGKLTVKEFDSVSPMVATETASNAIIAVAVAAIGILLYVTWAFRRMPHPLQYGSCAVLALLHDGLVTIGVFAILGGLLGWEVNLMFITGVLAVLGYSVNNTVVVFDRIRENQLKGAGNTFEETVNISLNETLVRSINTSLTTVFVVMALLLFVGASIQNFAVALLIGIVAGTYSSLFLAPLFLITWSKREWGSYFKWMIRRRNAV